MKRGTTILKCEPFCYIVREDKRPSVCDNCFAEVAEVDDPEVALKKCTQCKVARYCGVRCQGSYDLRGYYLLQSRTLFLLLNQ